MTTVARWNPFAQSVPTFFKDLDQLFEVQPTRRAFTPAADVIETADAYEVQVDLPGIKPEEINVKLEGDTLTLTAERKQAAKDEKTHALRNERSWGLFQRVFVLGDEVDGSKPEAKYEHGVLTVRLPKREERKPKTIQVKVAG
jgi:HSP20 family protein